MNSSTIRTGDFGLIWPLKPFPARACNADQRSGADPAGAPQGWAATGLAHQMQGTHVDKADLTAQVEKQTRVQRRPCRLLHLPYRWQRATARASPQQFSEPPCRHRGAEQKPLHLGATKFTKNPALRFRFNTLCRGTHTSRQGHGDHCLHDRRGSADLTNVFDETAINLDLVEGKALQVAQGRVSRAEIVKRDADTELAKLM